MRLTPKRENEIRLSQTDDYLDQIKDLLFEIDHLRANSAYQNKRHREEQNKNNAKEVEVIRALNMAKKALELANTVLAPTDEYYRARYSCEKALKLIKKLEK